jgi:hypothetical protein
MARGQDRLTALLKENSEVPLLRGNTMQAGDIGSFGMIEVVQILRDGEFLGRVPGGATVWFMFIGSTDNLVDGRRINDLKREYVFVVLGPKTYPTAIGSTRTVMQVAQLDPDIARSQAEADLGKVQ